MACMHACTCFQMHAPASTCMLSGRGWSVLHEILRKDSACSNQGDLGSCAGRRLASYRCDWRMCHVHVREAKNATALPHGPSASSPSPKNHEQYGETTHQCSSRTPKELLKCKSRPHGCAAKRLCRRARLEEPGTCRQDDRSAIRQHILAFSHPAQGGKRSCVAGKRSVQANARKPSQQWCKQQCGSRLSSCTANHVSKPECGLLPFLGCQQ